MSDYNEKSIDAVLSKILTNQEGHTRFLQDIKAEQQKTNGRVTALEREKWYNRGALATMAVLAPGAWEWVKIKLGAGQ